MRREAPRARVGSSALGVSAADASTRPPDAGESTPHPVVLCTCGSSLMARARSAASSLPPVVLYTCGGALAWLAGRWRWIRGHLVQLQLWAPMA